MFIQIYIYILVLASCCHSATLSALLLPLNLTLISNSTYHTAALIEERSHLPCYHTTTLTALSTSISTCRSAATALDLDLDLDLNLWSDLAITGNDPFVGGHLPEGHGAAGMQFLGADADFGTEAELCAIGEGRGYIRVDDGRIHLPEEFLCRFPVFGNNGLTMPGTVPGNMVKGLLQRTGCLYRHLQGEVFRAERFRSGREKQMRGITLLQHFISRFIGIHSHIFSGQREGQYGKVLQPAPVDHQAVKGIAYRRPAGFGIEDDLPAFPRISIRIKIGVANAGPCLNDRYGAVLPSRNRSMPGFRGE